MSLKRMGPARKDSILLKATAFSWYPGARSSGNLRFLASWSHDQVKAGSESTRVGWPYIIRAVRSGQDRWYFADLYSQRQRVRDTLKWWKMEMTSANDVKLPNLTPSPHSQWLSTLTVANPFFWPLETMEDQKKTRGFRPGLLLCGFYPLSLQGGQRGWKKGSPGQGWEQAWRKGTRAWQDAQSCPPPASGSLAQSSSDSHHHTQETQKGFGNNCQVQILIFMSMKNTA